MFNFYHLFNSILIEIINRKFGKIPIPEINDNYGLCNFIFLQEMRRLSYALVQKYERKVEVNIILLSQTFLHYV